MGRWSRVLGGLLAAAVLPASSLAASRSIDVPSLAQALERTPVQVVGSPSLSISDGEASALGARIRRVDRGRIWIAVVPSLSQGPTRRVSNALAGYLNADGGGTVVVVAGGSVWGSTSWEDGAAATARLAAAFKNPREPLARQLRTVIDSFASGDAAAGHPQITSSPGTASQSSTATQPSGPAPASNGNGNGSGSSSSSSSGGLIVALVALALVVLFVLARRGPRLRRVRRASHRRKQEQADAHEQAQADFIKLGEAIEALDIDSSMPNASARGNDEYAKALDCHDQAERRLKEADDEYQFERAVAALKEGLEHVHAAGQLLDQPADAPTPPA
jgi:hypothetical protein